MLHSSRWLIPEETANVADLKNCFIGEEKSFTMFRLAFMNVNSESDSMYEQEGQIAESLQFSSQSLWEDERRSSGPETMESRHGQGRVVTWDC